MSFSLEDCKELEGKFITFWTVEEVTKRPMIRTTGWWNFIYKENAEAFVKYMNDGEARGMGLEYRLIPGHFSDDIWKQRRRR